jgi:hypothetical protein
VHISIGLGIIYASSLQALECIGYLTFIWRYIQRTGSAQGLDEVAEAFRSFRQFKLPLSRCGKQGE